MTPLASRALLILQLLARGYTMRQIAQVLDSDEAQVAQAADQAAGRLGVCTWSEAVTIAQQRHLID